MNCAGCLAIDNPFWGECEIKNCCEAKGHSHCGGCSQIPCDNLTAFAFEGDESDNGTRIEHCKTWATEGFFSPTQFVQDMASRNAAALKEHFTPGAVIRWLDSREEFTPEEYIRANCEYPGQWQGKLQKVEKLAQADNLVMITQISSGKLAFNITSFIKLQQGKIAQLEEYYSECGEPPQWRKDMKVGKPI